MSVGIADDALLDYVTFQILQDNRYIAFVNSNEEEEMVTVGHGLLNQLLDHLPRIKDQIADAPSDYFKLELPENADKRAWFTKATLTRFLRIVGSPELEKSVNISNEISQLEETRNFHLSLYGKAEDGNISSDNSKNELLRAMDTRISALMEELMSTFDSVAGGVVSFQEMLDLQEFCRHFADVDVSNLLSKMTETSQKGQIVGPSENKSPIGNNQISGSSHSVEVVKYNASPAKAEEIERQNSTESENLGFSSEDDDPSVERSRTFIRSASPRRSASPMRRVQVGRTGSRRTHALTIKSLTCIPARERISSHRETESDCKSEESEEPDKRTEVNVTRISVQDAISLFEGKQRNETVDNRSRRSFNDSSTNTNKAVLRRWSSGMGEPQKSVTPSLSEQAVSEDKSEINAVSETVEVEMESETTNLNSDKVVASEPVFTGEKVCSDECSRQKEEELNKVVMKFVDHDQTDLKKAETNNSKNCKSRSEQNKERRNDKQKLRGEKPDLRAKKKKVPEKQEAEKSTVKAEIDKGKKQSIRTQNVKKNEPVGLSSRKESPKPAESNKISSRKTPSPQPTVRKSWPSTPSPSSAGTLHGKVTSGAVSSGTKAPQKSSQLSAPRQKPQSPGPVSRSSPKAERSQTQHKAVKKSQSDPKKRLSKVEDGKNQALPKGGNPMKVETKNTKTTKIRNVAPEANGSKRVTKKSSVVPVEAKASPSKDSDKVHLLEAGPTSSNGERETRARVDETLNKVDDPVKDMQDNAGAIISDTVRLAEEHPTLDLEQELHAEKANSDEKEISDETPREDDEIAERMGVTPAEIDPEQEPVISPAAWEESAHQDPSVSSLNNDTTASSELEPRARHSLSQILIQESSEPDVIEWGNAENPPTIVYQKDAPKGFKRLLKFARKNKGEVNGGASASPYTSDGEDDGNECRTLGKRDNLPKKVAVTSKSYAQGPTLSDSEPLSAQPNISNRSARSSHKFQEGNGTMKGARSFFSLSAFRGYKS